MKLTELFDSPIEPSRQRSSGEQHVTNFTIGDIHYEILISSIHDNEYEVMFDAEINGQKEDNATGTGNEIAVFSTVHAAVVKFLQANITEVKTLVFTSDIDSRTKLYQRIAAKWAKQFGLIVQSQVDMWGDHEFTLVNPNFRA